MKNRNLNKINKMYCEELDELEKVFHVFRISTNILFKMSIFLISSIMDRVERRKMAIILRDNRKLSRL